MEQSVYKRVSEVEQTHWWFVARRRIIDRVLTKYIEKKIGSALDIGCGTGGNIPLLFSHAASVTGLDMSETALGFVRSKYPAFRAVSGSFPEATLHETFELITLLDVLEHIEDDARSIKRIEDMLAPEGIVVITVPAFNFLWTGYDVSLRHHRRYTKKQLQSLLHANSELEILKLSYYNFFLFPLIWGVRFFRNVFGVHQHEEDLSIPAQGINRVLTWFFSLESLLLPSWNLPFGVSLICVARKREV